MVSESDCQHRNRDNNQQLAKATTSTRPILAISRAAGLPKFPSAADAELKALIPANLNRSENKPGNRNPKKQTNSARKEAKEPRQLAKQNCQLNEANFNITETNLKPPARRRTYLGNCRSITVGQSTSSPQRQIPPPQIAGNDNAGAEPNP
ncbi:hypothetical protein QL285_061304 [Trifolium repens]|nr:hypothetical protein QL285_061304 [Trifolium repens]